MVFISKSTFAVAVALAFAIFAFVNTTGESGGETSFRRRLRRNAMFSPVPRRNPEPYNRANERRAKDPARQAALARRQKTHEKLAKNKEFMNALFELGKEAQEAEGVGEVGSSWYQEQAANIEKAKGDLK